MIQTENTKIEISPENWYTGEKLKRKDNERDIRKVFGLPITKELIYYKDTRDKNSVTRIVKYRIDELFDETELWATFEIITESGCTVKIHSWFLRHMQKPSFIKDMEKMIREEMTDEDIEEQ
jgi:hypothetical protein